MKIYILLYCNALNLQLKINNVIKRIYTLIVVSVLVFSCNDGKDKTGTLKEDAVVRTTDNKDLIYLDTAENIRNILCQSWVMEDDEDALEGMAEDSKFDIPYRSFYFATDGSFVKNPRNAMDYGTWTYDDATKIININVADGGVKDIYKIARITFDELVLVNVGINSVTNLKFVSSGKRFKNASNETYHISNNRWRIPPQKKESDSAIHQRLKENIHFFILFYKSVLAKDDKSVSFWGLPSCFKWYGGAIYLKKEDELKENWIDCFYNKEQAMKAYAIADKLLSQKYEWPKGEQNWLKLNLAVVELMYKKMDEIR